MMTCTVCAHPNRAEIDRALIEKSSLRDIARQFGVNKSSVDRHKQHIPKALAKAKDAETVAESTSLLSRLTRLLNDCESASKEALGERNWTGAAAFAREIRGCIELLGKLSGELQGSGPKVAINIGDMTKIDIGGLTEDQLSALQSRLMSGLTDEELEQELMLGASSGGLVTSIREMALFDHETVPPGPGYEANNRQTESARESDVRSGRLPRGWNPWRVSSGADRLNMLRVLWRRLTGFGLDVPASSLSPYMEVAIEFDLREDVQRHYSGRPWPMVKLIRCGGLEMGSVIESESLSLKPPPRALP